MSVQLPLERFLYGLKDLRKSVEKLKMLVKIWQKYLASCTKTEIRWYSWKQYRLFCSSTVVRREPIVAFPWNYWIFYIVASDMYFTNTTNGMYFCVFMATLVTLTWHGVTLHIYRLSRFVESFISSKEKLYGPDSNSERFGNEKKLFFLSGMENSRDIQINQSCYCARNSERMFSSDIYHGIQSPADWMGEFLGE